MKENNMDEQKLQKFREGFCEKAAELGLCPSELLMFSKQSNWNLLKEYSWLGLPALALIAGGAGLGGLAAYGSNEFKKAIDPTEEMFGSEEDPVDEAKKLQLIAKYRSAINQVKNLQ